MRAAVFALITGLAAAQKEVSFASFGQRHSLELGYLPGWNLGGSQRPQVLGDKLVFTPPYPGEVTASAWTTQKLNSPDFTIDTKFLANGQEHGGGNLQIWYSKEGESAISSKSLYTVEKFTGLVIVVDQHGGPGGGIRGFLNDGTTSFKDHPHLDTAAFGHCDYAYRNRGLPSKLQIKHDANGLEVKINDKLCFKASNVVLPADYYLGLTASSTSTPDSFEVSKFVTTTSGNTAAPAQQNEQAQQAQQNQQTQQTQQQQPITPPDTQAPAQVAQVGQAGQAAAKPSIEIEHVQDILASTLSSSTAQFADLHNRLQTMGHNTERLFAEYIRSSAAMSTRIEEIHTRISALERSVQEVKSLVEGGGGDMRGMLGELHESVRARHEELTEALPVHMGNAIAKHGPSVGVWLLYVIILQACMAGAYVWWKRRREQIQKGGKYL